MLHQDPLMLDIDVNHWRNLQALLLESGKERRRIIVIHEHGTIEKFVHSQRLEIARPVERIDDPHAAAEQIYRANPGKADFVAVFERSAFDRYMAGWQDAWKPDEDLDAFVHRTYASMDEYADGIVTYPGLARETLGLQWRVGTSYGQIVAAVERFVPPQSSVVFGIFDGDVIWATLVLHFDADQRADVVTTIDTSRVDTSGGRQRAADAIVDWVDATYGRCSVALFADLPSARSFLASKDKSATLRDLASAGYLHAPRLPASFSPLVPVA